jgi:hypothetical protein
MSIFNIAAIALTIGATLALPLFMASTSARLTVSYARSQEYPLLCVSAIPDSKIANGHVHAMLRYARAPLILTLGLTPAFEIMLTYFVWLFTYYSHRWVGYDGAFAHTDLGVLGIVLKYALVTTALGLGLLGINLLAITLGVGYGLWWRRATPAAAAALISTVGITGFVAYATLKAGALLDIPDAFFRRLFQYTLFAPFPYILALGCIRLARRWARRPD